MILGVLLSQYQSYANTRVTPGTISLSRKHAPSNAARHTSHMLMPHLSTRTLRLVTTSLIVVSNRVRPVSTLYTPVAPPRITPVIPQMPPFWIAAHS